MKKLLKFISLILDDVLMLVGVSFLSYGVFQIHVPAGYITLGICFMAIAYLLAKRKGQ